MKYTLKFQCVLLTMDIFEGDDKYPSFDWANLWITCEVSGSFKFLPEEEALDFVCVSLVQIRQNLSLKQHLIFISLLIFSSTS